MNVNLLRYAKQNGCIYPAPGCVCVCVHAQAECVFDTFRIKYECVLFSWFICIVSRGTTREAVKYLTKQKYASVECNQRREI